MAIRSILFDLDDTLVVEGASADAAFVRMLIYPPLPFPHSQIPTESVRR